MKITVETIEPTQEEEVIIRCHEPSADWVDSIRCISVKDQELTGEAQGKVFRLHLRDIYYFEVVDRKSFIYCQNMIYESKLRLYEFEERCRGTMLFRASKSLILNADKIDHIEPSLSGRFIAALINGEKVVVSRQYVAELKRLLTI